MWEFVFISATRALVRLDTDVKWGGHLVFDSFWFSWSSSSSQKCSEKLGSASILANYVFMDTLCAHGDCSQWNSFLAPVKGNCKASAYRNIVDNCAIPTGLGFGFGLGLKYKKAHMSIIIRYLHTVCHIVYLSRSSIQKPNLSSLIWRLKKIQGKQASRFFLLHPHDGAKPRCSHIKDLHHQWAHTRTAIVHIEMTIHLTLLCSGTLCSPVYHVNILPWWSDILSRGI